MDRTLASLSAVALRCLRLLRLVGRPVRWWSNEPSLSAVNRYGASLSISCRRVSYRQVGRELVVDRRRENHHRTPSCPYCATEDAPRIFFCLGGGSPGSDLATTRFCWYTCMRIYLSTCIRCTYMQTWNNQMMTAQYCNYAEKQVRGSFENVLNCAF